MPFHRPINFARVVLAADHNVSDGHLVVVDPTVLGVPSAASPVKLVGGGGIFSVDGLSSDTLSIASMLEGTSDVHLPAGTALEVDLTAKDLTDLQLAIRTSYTFAAAGGPVTAGQKPATLLVAADSVAVELIVTASAGTVTARVEGSTDGGTTWSAVDTISLASGLSATKSSSGTLAAGTLLRVNYTAASGCDDPVVTLIARTS